MYTINLNINDDIVTVEYEVDIDYLIPENVETVDVTIVDCPQEIIDCFGEREIEQLIIEGIENERETARAEKIIREYTCPQCGSNTENYHCTHCDQRGQ